ncbi:tellurite resistance TerB family protein [Amorphus orientalis]|uniref:Tellurite resistance protein n=1 Tax=Amorphus orientalis TaxID=649198 RepID=A0AAE3VK15_9HYPH|nr:tellurite resistance TerB family protein [Amorphus orientalis]MDQ0313794.1 tellurite resistance protein [Amorphus orientalis]
MDQPISHHDALIYVMVTMSAVDRSMTDAELQRIGDIVRTLPVFRDFREGRLVEAAETCADILQADDGLETVLELIRTCIPAQLYETAYALGVEVAAADLHVEPEELRLLAMLRDRLELDKLTTAALERSARARYHTL